MERKEQNLEEEEVGMNLFSPKSGFTSVLAYKDQMLRRIQTLAPNRGLLMKMHVQDDANDVANALPSEACVSLNDFHVY